MADEVKAGETSPKGPSANGNTGGPEPEKKVKESAPTKEYVLKAGAEHYSIIDGEQQKLVGDEEGTVTVTLTKDQADAFSDKLDLKKSAPRLQDRSEIATRPLGGEFGGQATHAEAAAKAGAEAGIESSGSDDKPEADKGEEKKASEPAGSPHAGAGQTKSGQGTTQTDNSKK